MNWFEYSEQKKTLLTSGIIIICLAMLMVTARRNVAAFDAFWHLQTGLDWLNYGFSPWLDHYSFTFHGEEIANPPFIFQVLLAWLVTHFGLEPGFQVYKFVCFVSLLGLFIVILRRLRAPTIVYCIVLPMVVALLQYRTLTRPELVSYSFSVIAMMFYYRTKGELSTSGMLPIIGLMLLWNNYHSPIIGYVIFFGYFFDVALQQLHDGASARAWLTWMVWGIAIVAVGFVTPGLNHPLINVLFFSAEWKDLIQEYVFHKAYFSHVPFLILITLTLVTLVLLAWKRQFGLLIVCAVLTFSTASLVRLLAPSGIVMLCIFAWLMSDIDWEDLLRGLPAILRNAIGTMALLLVVLTLISGVSRSRLYMEENKVAALKFPSDVADYMIDYDIAGRIFNEYSIGGYLIYRLSPDSQVYIDGRTNILYPIDHLKHFYDALKSSDIFLQEVKRYDINLAILPNKLHFFSLVGKSGPLGLDFVGAEFSLFRQNRPNFPKLGTLLALPACWNQGLSAELEEEKIRAISILPSYSMLLPFAEFVMAYTLADKKNAYLENLEVTDDWPDSVLKFAAFQALNQRLDQLAFEFLDKIYQWDFRDFLASALAKIHLEEWQTAEKILHQATRNEWPRVAFNDLVILHALLEQIRQNSTLELIDDAYVDRLAEQVGASGDSFSSFGPDIRSFCPDTWQDPMR